MILMLADVISPPPYAIALIYRCVDVLLYVYAACRAAVYCLRRRLTRRFRRLRFACYLRRHVAYLYLSAPCRDAISRHAMLMRCH